MDIMVPLREEFERILAADEISEAMAACRRGIALIDQAIGGQTEPYDAPSV